MEYACIKAGRVENVILAEPDFLPLIATQWDLVVPVSGGAGIGWGWADSKFIEPTPPPTPPATVPAEVSMRQAQLALHRAGLLTTVDAVIASMPGPEGVEARITWAKSQVVQRHQPLVLALAPVLNLTEAQVDGLFITAAAIPP